VLLELRTSPQAARLLARLVRTGLFGTSVSAAAERLLLERLRQGDVQPFLGQLPQEASDGLQDGSEAFQGQVEGHRRDLALVSVVAHCRQLTILDILLL
jgi:hypothetical protein